MPYYIFYSWGDRRDSSPISTQQTSPYPFHSSLPFPSAYPLFFLLVFVSRGYSFLAAPAEKFSPLTCPHPSPPPSLYLTFSSSFLDYIFPLILITKFSKQCSRRCQRTRGKDISQEKLSWIFLLWFT